MVYQSSTRFAVFSLLSFGSYGRSNGDVSSAVSFQGKASQKPFRKVLIGVMSMLPEVDRRNSMRTSWIREAREAQLNVSVRFVIGRSDSEVAGAAFEDENKTYGDLVKVPCIENQHKGKTLFWFHHAFSHFGYQFDYVVKMDQDVYVWPHELHHHVQGFAERNFMGGVKVDVYFMNNRRDRFAFVNGGFAILSVDLAAEIADLVPRLKPSPEGFVNHYPSLQGNEDVILGRLFKDYWWSGRLQINSGEFPWSTAYWNGTGASSEFAKGSPEFFSRTCPWRHSKDLKLTSAYQRQWENRHVKGCRCNCPEEYTPEEATIEYQKQVKKLRASNSPFRTPEELEAWKDRMKAQQNKMNAQEDERLRREAKQKGNAHGKAQHTSTGDVDSNERWAEILSRPSPPREKRRQGTQTTKKEL